MCWYKNNSINNNPSGCWKSHYVWYNVVIKIRRRWDRIIYERISTGYSIRHISSASIAVISFIVFLFWLFFSFFSYDLWTTRSNLVRRVDRLPIELLWWHKDENSPRRHLKMKQKTFPILWHRKRKTFLIEFTLLSIQGSKRTFCKPSFVVGFKLITDIASSSLPFRLPFLELFFLFCNLNKYNMKLSVPKSMKVCSSMMSTTSFEPLNT